MRFTASSTNYDFNSYKVLLNESNMRRSIHQRMINKKGEFKKIGVSYVLDIEFYDMSATDKANLNTVFNDDYGDLTAISSIDEVESGETYVNYSGNMYIAQPTEVLKWRRSTNKKAIDNWKTKITVICDARTTPTKP